MSRAPWVLPKPPRPSRPATRRSVDHPRLAAGQPADAAEWTVSLGEADERCRRSRRRPRAPGRVRHALPPPRRPGLGRRVLRRPRVPVPGIDLDRDEGIGPTPPWRPWPASSPSFGPTAPSPRATPPPERRGFSGAGRERAGGVAHRTRPAGPRRRSWCGCSRAAALRLRAGPGRGEGARRSRHRLVRRRRGRAQRGVRRAVPGLPRRVEDRPRDRRHRGRAIAIGRPLGASGGRILGTLAACCVGAGSAGRRRDLHRRRPGPRGRARERRRGLGTRWSRSRPTPTRRSAGSPTAPRS